MRICLWGIGMHFKNLIANSAVMNRSVYSLFDAKKDAWWFQGQHTSGKLGAVSSEDDEDDFSPYGETSRDEAKEGYWILLFA